MQFKFESLDVYQKALEFANEIYLLTKKFPQEELFVLTSQLRRAAMPISLSVAEGSSRSKKQFCHFLDVARGSVYECIPLLSLSCKQGFVKENDYGKLYEECNRLAMMVNRLKRLLKRRYTVSSER